jgi:hypothetical protein
MDSGFCLTGIDNAESTAGSPLSRLVVQFLLCFIDIFDFWRRDPYCLFPSGAAAENFVYIVSFRKIEETGELPPFLIFPSPGIY